MGYKILTDIEVTIGNNTIFKIDNSLYGSYLDMINELNDPNKQEWEGVEKYESLNFVRKKYEKGVSEDVRLMIPLKLWCDKDINSAIPGHLLSDNNTKIKFFIQTANQQKLQFISNTGTTNNNSSAKIKTAFLHYKQYTLINSLPGIVDNFYEKREYEIFVDDYYGDTKSDITANNFSVILN